MSLQKLIIALILVSAVTSCNRKPDYPNVIFIMADDMGYGDVSALNADSKIITPNIDRLANEGMIFTDAHSGSAVCSPTRYGVLTGRYSWRSRLKSGVTWSWDTPLIDNERLTLASMLKEKGYATACIGKWHLGLGWVMDSAGVGDFSKPLTVSPNDNGFDYSYIITASLDIPPYVYIENGEVTAKPDRMTEDESKFSWWRLGHTGSDFKHDEVLPNFTDKAISWINDQANNGEKPFFLYLPLPAPHTPILPTGEFVGISNTNPYGDFVVMVDHMIGRVVASVEENGISDNTIIILTSDNGCSPEADFQQLAELDHHPSYVYRGHKADIFEGGHRVPFIVRWPEKIKAGSSSEQLTCLTDLMATMAEITDFDMPDSAAEDSYSILGSLTGSEAKGARNSVVHHSVGGFFALRQGDWKLNVCAGSGGWSYPTEKKAEELELPWFQLYNLRDDIAEKGNLAEEYPDRVEDMKSLLLEIIDNGRSTPGSPQTNTPAGGWPENKLRY